ncbi:MAG: D-glycero-beta-D-manno-heptose-7-phosphate kinase [Candidatus Eisenbacteria bacterium]|nr:D-glycero-beta-D-manno-heptose-7-phosphate kinase [Candidatus Eisenbacteria bacterium]
MTMELERVRELLERFSGRRVVILGDLMLDRYIWGAVERISPEAPVPVVDVSEETIRFGGAANVAENVAALGAYASLVGVVGDDPSGDQLLGLLRDRDVDVEGVIRVPERPTTVKTRIIAHNQQVVRADHEDASDVEGEPAERLVDVLTAAIENAEVLIVSDYGKGVITVPSISEGIRAARTGGKIICVDPKESHFQSYVGVTAITPNQKEAGGAVGMRITDEESLDRAGRELLSRLKAECVVITRGEEGMTLFMADGAKEHLPTVAREVYDVTGAGDTVVSALAVGLAAGASMVEAATVANHAAGMVIREVGTASVTREMIERSFEEFSKGEAGG